MICKYCKKKDHEIDDCPEIICKKCRIVGHPFWKCRNTTNKKKDKNKDSKQTLKKPLFKKEQDKTEINQKENSKQFGLFNRNLIKKHDETPAKINPVEKQDIVTGESWANVLVSGENRISYYLKYQNASWGDMI